MDIQCGMVGTVEVQTPGGKCRWLSQEPQRGETAPVRLRVGSIEWVQWGGMIPLSRARQQTLARPVLIPITAWSTAAPRFGWNLAKENEYLQGCLVRSVRKKLLVVFGVAVGDKPRLIEAEVKPTVQQKLRQNGRIDIVPIPGTDSEVAAYIKIGWMISTYDGNKVLRWPTIRGNPIFPGESKKSEDFTWISATQPIPWEYLQE